MRDCMRGGGARIDSVHGFKLSLLGYSSDQPSNTALLNRPGSICPEAADLPGCESRAGDHLGASILSACHDELANRL